nr:collagen alpha-1(I) chain-like [Kogia breviceps]
MAPAAAPPHRGRPADRNGPGQWPDRQGAGRLASPAAAASCPGRGYGQGGSEAAPAGGGSGGGFLGPAASPSAASAEEARRLVNPDGPQLRPKRRPPLPAALARFSGGSSSFVWVRNPAGIQLASPLLGLPLRPRQAESGGGSLSHSLISALTTGNAALPGPPESPPEGPGDRPGARVGRESHTGAHSVGHHHHRRRRPPSAAAHSAPGPPPSSGSQQARLGQPPPPRAHYPV